MLRLFIGYDEKETLAYHVLSHSIQRRSSIPISICPLNRATMKAVFDRPRGEYESTDFSISRFIVPYLCDYEGWAAFMDCDMLCLGDVAEFAGYASLMEKYATAVRVVKHEYQPSVDIKFLGQQQTKYEKKNWSSVMLFNNHLCRNLTPEYVNSAPGLALHRFQWIDERKIGGLPKEWNVLVGEPNQTDLRPKLIHYTLGGPWFPEYAACEYADAWRCELEDMNGR
jgi:lipopolysaccharide biosynthesis glycosyltransferase